MNTKTNLFLTLGAVLVAGFALATPSANASERVFVNASIGGPTYYAPAYYAPAPVVTGHYVTTYQNVLIEPEHHSRVWVPEVVSTYRDHHGIVVTAVTSPGYYREVVIPARFERRATQVWVDGCDDRVGVVYSAPRPRVSIGGFFHF